MKTPTAHDIERVAQHFRGEPNKELSKRSLGELRFGRRGSLAIDLNTVTYFDHEAKAGGGLLDLVCQESQQANGQALEWLASELGIDLRDDPPEPQRRELVARYTYRAADNEPYMQATKWRGPGHRFTQSHWDGKRWQPGTKGLKPVLYRLPELRAAGGRKTVLIAEGEKDAETLAALGFVATCNIGGAGKWRDSYSLELAGYRVVILADNDQAGRDHAQQVARSVHAHAASVRVVEFPELPAKGDVSEWIDRQRAAGLDNAAIAKALRERCRQTPEWEPPAEDAAPAEPSRPAAEPDGGEPSLAEFSDDDLAAEFTARHADDLRHVAAWGRWLIWSGHRWEFDTTLHVFDLARAICRAAAGRSGQPNQAKQLASAKTVAAVERLARADRQHAATVDQWDADPWLLNTPGGVVDLRTGDMRPARREDYLTKATTVTPDFKTDCPTWRRFLDTVTGGDSDLQDYLRRMAGYALTGSTREHMLSFLYGTGRNGKSTFLNILARILGGYQTTSSMEVFTASHGDRHPTELADLRGARLVTAIETEEGRRWAESKIKALTGGDPISARFMRQDFFEFIPQFKLVVAGNHKPGLRNVDEAMRRRLHLVPFTVTIPESQQDERLPGKLQAEAPAILAWCISGAVEWAGEGLRPPEAVRKATEEYLAAEDAISAWIEDQCSTGDQLWDTSARLWESWKAWAHRNNEPEGTRKRFGQRLEDRGFNPEKSQGVRGYRGLAVFQETQGFDHYAA